MRRFTRLIITGLSVLVIASTAHAADIDWDANLDKPKTVDIHGGRDFSKWADGYAKGWSAPRTLDQRYVRFSFT